MPWLSSGRLTNPAVDAVIVDSGQLPAGSRSFALVLAATVATVVEVQWRDAANTGTIQSQVFAVPPNSSAAFAGFPIGSEFTMLANQRLRVQMVNGPVGAVSCSLFHTQ